MSRTSQAASVGVMACGMLTSGLAPETRFVDKDNAVILSFFPSRLCKNKSLNKHTVVATRPNTNITMSYSMSSIQFSL